MRCKDARAILIGNEADKASAALLEHVAACPSCQAYARDAEGLRGGFRAFAREAVPEPSWGFAARVLRRLDELEERGRRANFLELVGRRVVYAAGVLTLLLILALVLPASGPLRGPTTAQLYWAQPDATLVASNPIFPDETGEARDSNRLAPVVNSTEGKQ
ncbi:MAG: hypothetical protein LAN62_13640 [Acidobacteriia bacterium]|nr:hypothetical protein [Terriglobia bacterium]